MALPVRRATPQRPPTRSRSRIAPAAPFNSGGLPPIVTVAVQKRRPTRAVPDVTFGVGAIAALSPQVVQAPQFNSGGLTPRVTQGVRRKNLSRPGDRLQVAPPFNSGSLTPLVVAGVRRRNLYRAPERLAAPAFNSGGIQPIVTRPVRYLPRPTRVRPSLYEPPYNSGGIQPLVTRGVVRRRSVALRPRLVAPAAQVVAPGTQPVVSQGRRWSRPTRTRPATFAPPYNSGGVLAIVVRGVLRKLRAALPGRLVVPPTPNVAAAGTPPRVTTGFRRPPPQRGHSRTQVAAPYNAGGISPVVLQGVRRKPAPGKPSRVAPAAPFNAGGIAASVTVGVRRLPAKGRPTRRVVATVAVLPGTTPVVTRQARAWAIVRRRVSLLVVAPVAGAITPGGPGSSPNRLLGAPGNQLAGAPGNRLLGSGGNRLGGS